jgi:hypothetical protein
MDEINFTNAIYLKTSGGTTVGVNVEIDGVFTTVPLDPANRHYAEILRQVEAGTLTIAPAEGAE